MSSFGKKTRNPGYKPGGHWVVCQRTGKVIRNWDARKEWTGLIVAKEEWESRHPQDLLRTRPDFTAAVGLVNPEGEPIFIEMGGTICIAGLMVAGEAITGTDFDPIPDGTFNTNTL